MRNLIFAFAVALLGQTAFAASIDPATTSFPWKNGPATDAVYKFSDHPNTVHVLEVWEISCVWCNRNSDQVKALATEYASDSRVQFIDMGLDQSRNAYDQWIRNHNPSYPVVQDVNEEVFQALRSEDGVPQTYVLDCNGNLVDYTVGYWGDAEKRTIRDAIAQAKQTTCN